MSRMYIIYTTYYLCGMMDGLSDAIRGIGEWIAGAKRMYLQKFTDRDTVPFEGLNAPSDEEMHRYAGIMRLYVPSAALRGVD